MVETLTFKTIVEAICEEVYAYHEKEYAIDRLVPPWEKTEVLHKPAGLAVGGVIHIQKMHQDWLVEHIECNKPYGFEDRQIVGFLSSFKHTHVFNRISETQTEIVDLVEYELPKGFIKKIIMKRVFKKHALKMFAYRHKIYQEDFKQFKLSKRKPLKILVSGAHGFVGKHLYMILDLFGDEVFRLVREPSNHLSDIYWDPEKTKAEMLEGFDVVIHLAGENITGSWSKEKKKRIIESRVNFTKSFTHALNQLKNPPKLFLCASACGFYGNREEELLDETSSKGGGFLADTVRSWESSAKEFVKGRVVSMRFGIVIGLNGGMLQKVIMPFKIGLGMIMGSGSEWMSWISIDDLAYMVLHILKQENIQGSINFTTPNPMTSKEFADTLASLLKKPVYFRLPRCIIKFLMGERGEQLLLTSAKVNPKVLMESGAVFSYPTLSEALKVYLGI